MLNRSVKAAKYDKIAFIDGDCVPHKHFVKSYIQQISDDSLNWGRRVMVGPKKTTELKQKGSVKELSFMSLLLSDSKKVKDGLYSSFFNLSYKFRGVKGCNWGILKKNLLEVNGFDEDYVRAGVGEDDDISWRLLEKGLKPVSMKNKAIVYHLHHPRGYSNEGVKLNRDMFRNKQKEYKLSCVNGMEKLTK